MIGRNLTTRDRASQSEQISWATFSGWLAINPDNAQNYPIASITLASAKPGDPTSKASRPASRFRQFLSSPCFDDFPRKSLNWRGK